VDKFVGDLIMVLFGAPEAKPDDATRAVACARGMLQARRELNATASHPFEIGIGIATGKVIAGCMGSDKRLSYTVLGHHVNLASRLCSNAGAGQILIDTATLAKLKEPQETSELPPIRLKGISDEIVVHALYE
jgi:class 3 adenylate cyclase